MMPKVVYSFLPSGPWQRVLRACSCRWRKLRFLLDARSSLSHLALGRDIRLAVPVRVGGGRGTLQLDEGVQLGFEMGPRIGNGTILLQPRAQNAAIHLGPQTVLSNNISVVAMGRVRIGANCRVGDLVAIYDCDFHEIDPEDRNAGVGPIEPVTIEDNVWLGSRVLVLRGVTIGTGSVIGAGSVVTRSIPARCLAVGAPARIVRTL
jgi:maltose O-acetyltransferase